jgi:hypothetical protein
MRGDEEKGRALGLCPGICGKTELCRSPAFTMKAALAEKNKAQGDVLDAITGTPPFGAVNEGAMSPTSKPNVMRDLLTKALRDLDWSQQSEPRLHPGRWRCYFPLATIGSYSDLAVDEVSSVCEEVDRAACAARTASSACGDAGVVETAPIAWASSVLLLSFAVAEVAGP